jgi:hypothetical protein
MTPKISKISAIFKQKLHSKLMSDALTYQLSVNRAKEQRGRGTFNFQRVITVRHCFAQKLQSNESKYHDISEDL